MRTLLISLAAGASALVVASPASAQYYPYQPQPQGYAYGYHNNWGSVRSLQVRIDNLQRRIAMLDNRDRITEREARRLRDDARDLERRLQRAARNGLHPNERAGIEVRLARLEQRLFRDARDGRNWGRDGWNDRDRDGRDDRWEDDRGRYPG
jgi:hypothetical protein